MTQSQQHAVTAGERCEISAQCSLENVTLGDGVRIADGAQLKNVVVGSRTKISRNVTLYSSDPGRPVRIGHDCWLSVGVFGEGTGGEIRVGDYAVIAHRTTILTSSGPGEQSPIMNELFPVQLGAVVIGEHAWLGAHTLVLPDTTLGEGVVIAASSVVRAGRYDDWRIYGGSPARLIRELDRRAVDDAKARFAARGRSD